MLEDKAELKKIIITAIELFRQDNNAQVVGLLENAEITSDAEHYDNWNGGITYYAIKIVTDVATFSSIHKSQDLVENEIKEKVEILLRPYDGVVVSRVMIIPFSESKIDFNKIANFYSQEELVADIQILKNILISVSTGGQRIQDANENYQKKYSKVSQALRRLNIEDPNKYDDLWQWYGRWKAGDLPSYKDRRVFISDLYSSLLQILQVVEKTEMLDVTVNLSGWERINRTINEIRMRNGQAVNEEQFQAVGLLCREAIISLAQLVFIEEKHPTMDGVKASRTDAKRMLEAYIADQLKERTNETLRKYARSSLELANELTHKRTATKKLAALCISATISLVNLIGILEER